MTTDSGFDPSTTLYPQERNAIIKVWYDIQKKYLGKIDDLRNMFEIRKEITDKFREIGWDVVIDFTSEPDLETGRMMTIPTVDLVGRVNDTGEFDHDRMRYEVQAGALDGVEGTMKADGTISEPSKKSF